MSDELQSAIISALSDDNLKRATRNKSWIKHQMNTQRKHEMDLAIMNAFAADPELKYWVGAGIGVGAAYVSTLFTQSSKKDNENTPQPLDLTSNFYETVLGAGSPLLSAANFFDFNKDGEGGLAGNIFGFATGSLTAWNMVCLLLRNASGGSEGGSLSSKLGAIL